MSATASRMPSPCGRPATAIGCAAAHPDDIVVAVGFSPDRTAPGDGAGTTVRTGTSATAASLSAETRQRHVDDVVFTADGPPSEQRPKPQPCGSEIRPACPRGTPVPARCGGPAPGTSATAFSPDGSHVVLAERHGGVSVRNLATGTLITEVKGTRRRGLPIDRGAQRATPLRRRRDRCAEEPLALYRRHRRRRAAEKISLDSRASQLAFSADERRLPAATGQVSRCGKSAAAARLRGSRSRQARTPLHTRRWAASRDRQPRSECACVEDSADQGSRALRVGRQYQSRRLQPGHGAGCRGELGPHGARLAIGKPIPPRRHARVSVGT